MGLTTSVDRTAKCKLSITLSITIWITYAGNNFAKNTFKGRKKNVKKSSFTAYRY